MTENFSSLNEQSVVASLMSSQAVTKAAPVRCAKLETMSISELLYQVIVMEQKTAA